MNTFFIITIFTMTSLSTLTSYVMATDSITLKNGNKLSGGLTDSDTEGVLTLVHQISSLPIKIKELSVQKIEFDADAEDSDNASLTENIRLTNGDHFPCTITELNDKTISFQSDTIGKHTIARDKVSLIKFNTQTNNSLYLGPGNDLSAWTTSSDDWKLENGKLSTLNRSDASINIPKLTPNYILEFNLAWEEATPHLRFCFSSDTKLADRNSDYYFIDLTSRGASIHRSLRGKFDDLAQIQAKRELYEKNSLHVAIHVDRNNKKMALYFNGQLFKIISDKINTAPQGSYIVIKSLQRQGILTEISDIKVTSWGGNISDNMEAKPESLTKNDLITDLSGNVITGQIIGLSLDDGEAKLSFKVPFAKNDSVILGKVIDQLEFKTSANSAESNLAHFHLKLVTGGIVSYSSSQIINGDFIVEHPILGKVSIQKSSLSSVVSIPQSSKKTDAK